MEETAKKIEFISHNFNFGVSESSIEDGNIEISDKLYKIYKEKTFSVINNIKNIGLPKNGEQIRLITMKSFNSIAFIELIANDEIIEDMVLVIFAINIKAAKLILELYNDGKIKNIELIISSIRNAGHKMKSKAVELLSNNKGIKMIFVNSHAKISALKTMSGNYYVLEGSGNFSYNGRIEQYIIDNDKKLFEFTKKWICNMKESMSNYKDYNEFN